MAATLTRPPAAHGQHVLNGRVQRSMEGWSVIEKVVDFTHAVCRLSDGGGSAILVALPSQQSAACDGLASALSGESCKRTGVLLTTSFVLPTCDDCEGATVTFLEQPVAGTDAQQGRRVGPVVMPIRAEKMFACSASHVVTHGEVKEKLAEGNLGYTLTLCDMTPISTAGGSGEKTPTSVAKSSPALSNEGSPMRKQLSANSAWFSSVPSTYTIRGTEYPELKLIKPIPLPLLLSKIAPVCVGDSHLMITHINGMERHYVVQTVKSVEKDSCEYEFFDPSSEFSSGGPIFNMQGDLVGIQHQSEDHSYGIFISSIVRHLFESMLLGVCRLPIAERREEEAQEDQFDDAFNAKLNAKQRTLVLNAGAGDQLIEYEEFKRMHVRKKLPSSLDVPNSSQVWKEFYTDFHSLVLILHAFSHAPRVAKLALETITSHEHKHHLPNIAALGGIGAILELIDGYPQNEEIVVVALPVLARASLYPTNSEAIFRCDGVLTVMEIMNEYSHQPCVQQWGFYCLYNVMAADSPNRAAAVHLFDRRQGIALAIEALRVHQTERHVLRHTGFALSCVAHEDQRYARRMVRGGLAPILIERMHSNVDDVFVFMGLVTLLEELLRHVPRGQTPTTNSPVSMKTPTISCKNVECTVLHQSNTDIMRYLIETLLQGRAVSVLTTVIAREVCDKYSSAAVSILEKCVQSVLVLLESSSPVMEGEETIALLTESCRTAIQNFTNERRLAEHAKEIMELLGAG